MVVDSIGETVSEEISKALCSKFETEVLMQ